MIQIVIKRMAAFIVVTLLTGSAFAQDRSKQLERIYGAGMVLNEVMAAPDRGIPEEILGSAECVAIVPSLLKAGFVFGGEYGHGVASCRTSSGWSAPAFFGIKAGTFGLQIGGQAVDLVMLIMNEKGMRNLLSSKFELGADASVAAGPVGRHAQGATDWKFRAQVLTYSRARGVFGGLTLKGALIKQDTEDTRIFYGRMVPYRTLLTGGVAAPADAQTFLSVLQKHAPVMVAPSKTAILNNKATQTPNKQATDNAIVGNRTVENKAAEPAADPKNAETKPPEASAPEPKGPETKTPETKSPETKTPQNR